MVLATASFVSLIVGLVIGYRKGYREGSTHGYRVGKQFGNGAVKQWDKTDFGFNDKEVKI